MTRLPALGATNGWPGERWLDVRRIDLLAPIMEARLDHAVTRGCDGVVEAGKAVFGVEYEGRPNKFCPTANEMGFSWLRKRTSLSSWRVDCLTRSTRPPELGHNRHVARQPKCQVGAPDPPH
jgi:hypothetical protein